MKAGDRIYWTNQREKALLKLGKKADRGAKHLDWQYAVDMCPKEAEILKDRSIEQIRKIYSRIVKSTQGLCAWGKCKNITSGGNRYCGKHRKEQAERSLEYWNKKGKAQRKEKKSRT